MTNLKQYAVSLLLIAAIAAVDRYLIIEQQATSSDMVWIDGSEFTASTADDFTERDLSQDFQRVGFWIDGSVVSKSNYQEFLNESSYVGAPVVKPTTMIVNTSSPHVPKPEQIFALHDDPQLDFEENSLQYISATDALKYCNWRGMELSTREQDMRVLHEGVANITIHASHPMSDLSGFRCVKLAN